MADHEAIIVGAGFGGMGAGIQLDRTGLTDWVILDREDDLGGTWHVNRYPGLAVDIASVTYSYSFEPNPHWSRLFAPGAELKQYADHVADKYDLRRRMRFGHTVDGARWDDDERHWVVTVRDRPPMTAQFLLTATGFLSQPRLPDIDGVESFAGTVVHTADWPDGLDLTGRRTAIIGTGATAVQLIPEVARVAESLVVFQRTPIWLTPKIDGHVPRPVRSLFAKVPLAQQVARKANDTMLETLMVGVLHFRQASLGNRVAKLLAKAQLRAQVKDPETRAKLTPHYDFGCKRPTFSNTYLPTFNRDDVTLETTTIARIEPDAVVTEDGTRHEVDTLVLATGFSLWETNFPPFEVLGRDGRDLAKTWREGRWGSYQGVSVPGFPNLFSLVSPYAYTSLSYFNTIESQMIHVDRVLDELRRRQAVTFEVTEEAHDRFTSEAERRLDDSVFLNGDCASARSYYFAPDGTPALLRPTSTRSAYRAQATFPLDDYRYAR